MLQKIRTHLEKPDKWVYTLLIILISAALLLKYIPNCGMKYDAGMYAGIARSIYEKGEYSYNGVKGDLPPIFPLMLAAAMPFGEKAIDYVTPLAAILLGISSFFFLRIFGREIYAFLISLLLITNPAIFEYSIGHFRDVPVMFFTVMFYLLYELALVSDGKPARQKYYSTGIGVFFALGFLSTYSTILYVLPLLLHSMWNRKSFIINAAASAAILIAPWALWSQINFGSPFYEHSGYLIHYVDIPSGLDYFLKVTLPSFTRFSILLIIPGLLGLLIEAKNKGITSLARERYLQLALFTILPNSVWPEQTVRYIFPVLITLGYYAMIFLKTIKTTRILSLLLVMGVLFQGITSVGLADYNCPRFLLLEDAGKWAMEHTAPDESLMANSFYQINYFSQRITYQLHRDGASDDSIIQNKRISYIILDSYEPNAPDPSYFDRFELVKEFSQDTETVKIYRVK